MLVKDNQKARGVKNHYAIGDVVTTICTSAATCAPRFRPEFHCTRPLLPISIRSTTNKSVCYTFFPTNWQVFLWPGLEFPFPAYQIRSWGLPVAALFSIWLPVNFRRLMQYDPPDKQTALLTSFSIWRIRYCDIRKISHGSFSKSYCTIYLLIFLERQF